MKTLFMMPNSVCDGDYRKNIPTGLALPVSGSGCAGSVPTVSSTDYHPALHAGNSLAIRCGNSFHFSLTGGFTVTGIAGHHAVFVEEVQVAFPEALLTARLASCLVTPKLVVVHLFILVGRTSAFSWGSKGEPEIPNS